MFFLAVSSRREVRRHDGRAMPERQTPAGRTGLRGGRSDACSALGEPPPLAPAVRGPWARSAAIGGPRAPVPRLCAPARAALPLARTPHPRVGRSSKCQPTARATPAAVEPGGRRRRVGSTGWRRAGCGSSIWRGRSKDFSMPSIVRTLVENENLGELRLGQSPSAWRVSSAGTQQGVGCDGRFAVHRGSPGRRSLPPPPL
jgi:hypothetical protein